MDAKELTLQLLLFYAGNRFCSLIAMKSDWKRVFATIWAGQIFSILTSYIAGYAIIIWLSLKTGSAGVLVTSTVASLLPQSIIGLFAGVYIDRWKRKRVMIIADSYIAFCTLGLVFMFKFGDVELWHVYLLLALRSVGSSFHAPAMQAAIPLLAPESQLMRIAGINQVLQSVSNIAGPVLAAFLLSVADMSVILLIDVAGALIACFSLLFVKIPNPKHDITTKLHLINDMRASLAEIGRHRGLGWLVVLSVAAMFFIMPISALFPLMTFNHFGGTAYQMSFVEVAWGAGMLLGGVAVGVLGGKSNKVVLISLTYIVLGVTFALSGFQPASEFGFAIFVASTGVGGLVVALNNAAEIAIMQTVLNPAVMGRVFSMYSSLCLIPSIIGLLGFGHTADKVSIPLVFIICGLAVAAIGAQILVIPAIKVLKFRFRKKGV